MKKAMENWLIGLVLGFVLRQIDKFRNDLNWAKLKVEAAGYVADLVPGTWFDAEAIKLVHVVIDAGERALGDKENLEDLFQALSAKDWPEALMELKELVLKAWDPGEDKGQKLAYQALSDFKMAA